MVQPPPTSPARRSRLQFSLRLLLIGLTAFAIGFPIWYRWPYVETEVVYFGSGKSQRPLRTMSSTWRRTWGGGKAKHGRAIGEYLQWEKTVSHFQDGKLHGPYAVHFQGQLTLKGQYVHGQMEGAWVEFDEGYTYTTHWHNDLRHGPYIVESPDGRKQQGLFKAGRLTEMNGQPIQNPLLNQLESGSIDNRRIAAALSQTMSMGMEFSETPLKDAFQYLQDQSNIPMYLDTRRLKDLDLPVTMNFKGIDLCSALALLTTEYKLGCHYRYGALFLTTPEHAKDWRDETGVAEIQPAASSDLARAWNEPTAVEAYESPLDAELQRLTQRLAIEVDTSRIAPSPERPTGILLTANFKNLPFRHALAIVLDQTGCTCRLEGEKLVILPPEASSH